MASHPDEAVTPEREVPSAAIAEAQLRHEQADSDLATPQEKKQAAVEQAHALSTRPDGSYAQLHETARPSLAVADEGRKQEGQKDLAVDEPIVKGESAEESSRVQQAGVESAALGSAAPESKRAAEKRSESSDKK